MALPARRAVFSHRVGCWPARRLFRGVAMDLATARPSRPFPLPGDMPKADPLKPFWRGVAATVLSELENRAPPEIHLREKWPSMATRTATIPADTTTSGWASTLAVTKVADLLTGLAPRSAAARLFEAGTLIDLSGVNTASI